MTRLIAGPLTAAAFAPFGEVLEATGAPDRVINGGMCGRFHDRATIDIRDGHAGISLFLGQPYALPLKLEMVERHPLGSQAFLPMTPAPFLVVVAPDENGKPGIPQAFLTSGRQGVNYFRNTWHGVLTPLGAPQLFAVVDRIGEGDNLEEYRFQAPYQITDQPQ